MLVNGQRYSHILTPQTGWPISDSFASVSVVAPLCLVAGTVATVAMLEPESVATEWLAAMESPHLWVNAAGDVGGSIVQI